MDVAESPFKDVAHVDVKEAKITHKKPEKNTADKIKETIEDKKPIENPENKKEEIEKRSATVETDEVDEQDDTIATSSNLSTWAAIGTIGGLALLGVAGGAVAIHSRRNKNRYLEGEHYSHSGNPDGEGEEPLLKPDPASSEKL